MTNEFKSKALSLLAQGYEVVPLPKGTKGPRETGWQKDPVTKERVAKWAAASRDGCGVGIRTEHTPAIDIDVQDPEIVELLVTWLEENLKGTLVYRVGQAPKVLVVCRAKKPGRKLASAKFEDVFGGSHQVEILRKGQQFAAYHTHPTTQKPYTYTGASLEDVPVEDLPVLSEKKALAFIEYFHSIAPEHWTEAKKAVVRGGDSDDALSGLSPRADIDDDKVASILADLPASEDYDTWLNVGMALHHQLGGAEGFQAWTNWSKGSKSYDYKECEGKWRSFGRYNGPPVTFATVLKMHQKIVGGSTKKKLEGDTPPPEEADDLTEFLKRYAFMPEGNSVVDLKRPIDLAVMEIASFRNLTANKRMEVPAPTVKDPEGTKMEPVHKFWLTNNDRMTVEGTTYDPGTAKRITKGADNRLFLNKAHFPNHVRLLKAPDREPRSIATFTRHMEYILPDAKEREWFMGWLAFNVQRPADRCKVTPLHVSKHHRTGRGWIVELLEKLLGEWNVSKAKMKHICGGGSAAQFDDYLFESLVCAIEEVKEADHRYSISDEVRDLLTENRLNLNLKYGGKGTKRVHTNFFWMSNHEDALVIPRDDKRIVVLSGPTFVQPAEYYDTLYSWIKGPEGKENIAELWRYLKKVDLSGFEWQTAPQTKGRARMIDYNLTGTEEVFNQWLQENPFALVERAVIDEQLNALAERDGYAEFIEPKQVNKLLQQHATQYKQVRLGGRESRRVRPWLFGNDPAAEFTPEEARELLAEADKFLDN